MSPTGTAGGAGTAERPWDLATALAQPATVGPGDTIWLRAGTYRGDFDSYLRGTSSSPIIVRAVPGERVTVDGRFEIHGTDGIYWGLEVMSSHPARFSSQPGSWPTDVPRSGRSVALRNGDNTVVNMVIHDLGGGLSVQSNSAGHELYGNLIYNNGWQGPDRAHGHGIYVQEPGRIEDNVLFQNFGNGFSVFGKGVTARGIDIVGNVSFNSGIHSSDGGNDVVAAGTSAGLANIHIRENLVYRSDRSLALKLGNAHGMPEEDVDVHGNYIVGQTWAEDWREFVFHRNTVVGGTDYIVRINPDGGSAAGYSLEENSYRWTAGRVLPFLLVGRGGASLEAWRVYGFDGSSSLIEGDPLTTRVFVRPNRWEQGRAHVVVYNWARLSSVEVDLSGVLRNGQKYEVRHVTDFFGPPAASGTYSGGGVSIPLADPPLARPVGGSHYPVKGTAPEFYVFVVVPVRA